MGARRCRSASLTAAAIAAVAVTAVPLLGATNAKALFRAVHVSVRNNTSKTLVVDRGWLIYNVDERRRTFLVTYGKQDVEPGHVAYLTIKETSIWIGLEGCGSFEFANPWIGFPYFSYGFIHHLGVSHYVTFSAGRSVPFRESTSYSFSEKGHEFRVDRTKDSADFKNFTLFVRSC